MKNIICSCNRCKSFVEVETSNIKYDRVIPCPECVVGKVIIYGSK